MAAKKKYSRAKVKPISIGWGGESEIFDVRSLRLKNALSRMHEVVKVYRRPVNVKCIHYAHKIAELLFPGVPVEATGSRLHDRDAVFEPPAKRAEHAPKLFMKLAKQNPELVEYQVQRIKLARMREQKTGRGKEKKQLRLVREALERHAARIARNPEAIRLANEVRDAGIVFDPEPHNVAMVPGGKIVIFDIYAVETGRVRRHMAAHDYPGRVRRLVEKRLKRYKTLIEQETALAKQRGG